jgi:hypothetical protein
LCHSELSSGANPRCWECGWLVCADGACQCPDFATNNGGDQRACTMQTLRIGSAAFARLVDLRRHITVDGGQGAASAPPRR